MLVPAWATWEHFRELDRKGLMMYGQMTAGSWIYIGTQGILQGTYETFAEAARQHFGGIARGAGWSLTAGLGGMGGAQPLAATMNEGVMLAVEVDRHRIERRLETRYLDEMTREPRRGARARARGAGRGPAALDRPARQRGRRAAGARAPRRRARPRHRPDERARSAERLRAQRHELRGGAARCAQSDPDALHGRGAAQHGRARARHARPAEARARSPSTTATTSAPRRRRPGWRTPSTSRASCPPTSGRSSARARVRSAGSCSPAIPPTSPSPTTRCSAPSPTTSALARWIPLARERVQLQGLPARICWLGYGERAKMGLVFNELVRTGARQGARSSSAATTSTPARWPRPTARPRP